MFVFGQNCFIRAKMVVNGQKWLYSGKKFRIRAQVDEFVKSGCSWAKVVVFKQKWLYSGKAVVFGKSFHIRRKVDVFGKSCFN